MARKRQTELPGAEKAQPSGIDDELVVEVQELTEAWQTAGAAMREKRAELLAQMLQGGIEEYTTHDGYTCALARGTDKVKVAKPREQ